MGNVKDAVRGATKDADPDRDTMDDDRDRESVTKVNRE
jgi:hypothetical protein